MRLPQILSGLSLASAQALSSSSSRPVSSSSLSVSVQNSTSSIKSSASSSNSASSSALSSESISASPKSASLSTPTMTPTIANISNSAVITPKPSVYVNPWAGNLTGKVPPQGTGSAYALQCQNDWYSYSSDRDYWEGVWATTFVTTQTIYPNTSYTVNTYYNTEYYTLCDGHPRVITSTPTETRTTTYKPITTTYLVGQVGRKEYPQPNCTVKWDDCEGLWSRYYSASSVYKEVGFAMSNTVVSLGPGASYWVVDGVTTKFPTPNPEKITLADEDITSMWRGPQGTAVPSYLIINKFKPGQLVCACGKEVTAGGPAVTITNTPSFTQTPYTPSCRTARPTCTAGQKCQIAGDKVEIYWFPPATNVSRDHCATAAPPPITSRPPTNFTWTPISTGPYAVLPGNTTWFSGNIYVSFNNIHGQCDWSGTNVEVGATHHGSVLTMAPSELYSMRATAGIVTINGQTLDGWDWEPNGYSFNTEDLISPYPWSAWTALDYCAYDRCSTMEGAYNPRIVVPEAIRRMDPRWSTCDLALEGLYDPPIALRSVGNMFATTTTPPPSGPQPTPGQSPPQQQEPTNTPIQPGQPPAWQTAPAGPSDPQIPQDPQNPNPNPGNQPQNPGQPQNPSQPQNPNPVPNNPQQPNPPLPQPAPVPAPTTIGTIGTIPIVVVPNPTSPGQSPGQVIVGPNQPLSPNGPPMTLDPGTVISMPDPGHIVISSPGGAAPSTINVPAPIGGPGGAPTPTAGAVLTMPDGSRVTATAILGQGPNGQGSATSVLVSGTLFSVGGAPVTLDNGMVLTAAPGGAGVVLVNPSSGATSTLAFSSISGVYNPPMITPPPVALVTVGGRVYTATSAGGSVVVGELGLTLTQGQVTTVDGTVVSNAGGSTGVVVGSSTAKFPTATGTGGNGGGPFTGAGVRVRGEGWWMGVVVGLMAVVFAL